MDYYKSTAPQQHEYDLDDLKTYPPVWLEMSVHELFDECWTQMGKSLYYMQHMYPSEFKGGEQAERVDRMCYHFAQEYRGHRMDDTLENRLWFMKFLFKFLDEVENQC